MYAKQGNSQGRRTPLSLSAAAAPTTHHKQQQQQQHELQHHQQQQQQHYYQQHHQSHSKVSKSAANGNSNMSAKGEHKNAAMQYKTEPTLADLKRQQQLEKKQQQQLQQQQQQQQQQNDNQKKPVEKNDEKQRTQNVNGNKNNAGGNANAGAAAANGKEAHPQNGNSSNNDKSNGNHDVAVVVKDKKEQKEKANVEKQQEKNEKAEKNSKAQNNKEDKKSNAIVNINDKEGTKIEVEQEKKNENTPKDTAAKKDEIEKVKNTKNTDVGDSNANNGPQKTPVKTNDKEKKSTPANKVVAEKATKVTPPNNNNKGKSTIVASATTTTPAATVDAIADSDDVEMEPLKVDKSPMKQGETVTNSLPAATSTPGKSIDVGKSSKATNAKSEIQMAATWQAASGGSPDRNNCPLTFKQISGRRSIRPMNEFAPMHYRESYRRINTELDVTSNTNTSLNVTVGSEVPNNSSFSIFGRGRKRDRATLSQSQMELQHDVEMSPPKRVRLDMHGFFAVVASPLTMLRSRFSKTSIQSSTPVKLSSKLANDDDKGEVQNVSGISIHEEMPSVASVEAAEEITATEDVTVGGNKSSSGGDGASDEADNLQLLNNDKNTSEVKDKKTESAEAMDAGGDAGQSDVSNDKSATTSINGVNSGDDIDIKATPVAAAKNKRCLIM